MLEHLHQTLQTSLFVKFNSFPPLFFLHQNLQNSYCLEICYSELLYMKVTVAHVNYFLLFFLSPFWFILSPLLCFFVRSPANSFQKYQKTQRNPNQQTQSKSTQINMPKINTPKINTPMLFNSRNISKFLLPKPKS
jgi:hypothetical protein